MIKETKVNLWTSGIVVLLAVVALPGLAAAEEGFQLWADPIDLWVLE